MKKIGLVSFLVLALMLSACASGGAEQTPGALGTDAGLGTDTGLGTETGAATEMSTEPASTMAATMAATEAATEDAAPTTEVQTTAEVETGIVAAPFSMFTVASVTGQTGTGGDTGTGSSGTGIGTQAAVTGTQTMGTGTQAAGTGTQAVGMGTQAVGTGTRTAGQIDQNRLLVRASELMGSDIVDMNGEMVGMVSDVLVDQTGNIQYIVFDAAEFLGTGTGGDTGGTGTGIGTQAVEGTAAPVGTLDNSTAVVGTIEPAGTAGAEGTAGMGTQAVGANTPEAIATSTVGEGTAMPNMGVMADENTILVFNGTADNLQTQGIMLPQAAQDMEGLTFATTGGDMPVNMADLNGLVRVSRITEVNVMNGQDEDLGQVQDVLVDIRQGMVAYGLMDFGGFLGIAENTVAVPWEQFTMSAEAGATVDANLMLDVTEDTLQNAPQLDMSSWQSWPNQIPMDWETESSTFWETAS